LSGNLSVLVPITITSAILQSTTAVAAAYPAWDNTTSFALGAYCYSPVTQHIYRSLIASNAGKDPTDPVNRVAASTGGVVYWQDVGPTNPWAMFDKKIGTATTANGDLTVVLRPGAAGSLYVVGVSAGVLSVIVKDAPGGTVAYSYSGAMEASAPADYWEYFYDPFEPLTDRLLTDLPPYGTAEITVSLTGGGTISCGALAVGDIKVLGETLADAEAEPTSFAYVDTDQWGNTDIVDGPSATNLSMSAVTESRAAGLRAQQIVTSLLGKPAFWFCSDRPDTAGLRTWGLGSGKFSYRGDRCNISMTVKGLI
jgi:hypothetical protein